MNASVTMRQSGQSKKTVEARLSFEERKFFPFVKCVYIFLAPSVFLIQPCILQHVSSFWSGSSCPVLQTSDVVHRNLLDIVIHVFTSEKKSPIVMSGELVGRWDHHDQSISNARAQSSSGVTLRLLPWTKWQAAVLAAMDKQNSPGYLDYCWMLFSSEHAKSVRSKETCNRTPNGITMELFLMCSIVIGGCSDPHLLCSYSLKRGLQFL